MHTIMQKSIRKRSINADKVSHLAPLPKVTCSESCEKEKKSDFSSW